MRGAGMFWRQLKPMAPKNPYIAALTVREVKKIALRLERKIGATLTQSGSNTKCDHI